MMLSGHVAVTALSFQALTDPTTIIAANLIAHPILDAVPHLDWHTVWERPHGKLLATAFTLVDTIVGLGLIVLILDRTALDPALVIGAVIAGMWLDLLDPLLRRVRAFTPLRRFHIWLHAWPAQVQHGGRVRWHHSLTGKTPAWAKLVIQVGLVAAGFSAVL